MIDLLALIPFDWIACAVVAPHGGDSMLARYLTLLGLLRLLRLYRVGVLLSYLGVNLSVSLAIVTITRNFMARLRGRRSGGPGRGCEVVRRPTNAASHPPSAPPRCRWCSTSPTGQRAGSTSLPVCTAWGRARGSGSTLLLWRP